MARATLIIPQYGLSDLTIQCVRSLRRTDARDWPMVIVSDGCEPVEVEALQEEFAADTGVTIVVQPHRGLTAAWNRGAKVARTEALIFLNNDILCRGDWGARFLECLVNAPVGLCGAALRREKLPTGLKQRELELRFFEGWCLGVRWELFEALGGFDPGLVLYWSDTDFQMRCALALGHWDWLRSGLVEGLPFRHLKHRTTRSREIRQRCRLQWKQDRMTFTDKWEEILNSSDNDFPWIQNVEAAADL